MRNQACLQGVPREIGPLSPAEGKELVRLGLALNLNSGRMTKAEQELRPKPEPWMLRFDRQRLYAEVWSEPAEKVAARYGISGAAIAKVCRCLRIPKPPLGYWAKKTAGQRTAPRPKLPRSEDENAGKKHRSR